jgi:hypothetical protein
MSTAVGQPIGDVITIRDNANDPILTLIAGDFATLEAYSLTVPATTAVVDLDEIDGGQYATSFEPSTGGVWILHYVYDDTPVFREESRRYEVSASVALNVSFAGGTWTYTDDPENVPLDAVRSAIGDTDSTNPQLSDAQIMYRLGTAADSVRGATMALLLDLAAAYAGAADTSELDLSVKLSQISAGYLRLYDKLKEEGEITALASAVPFAGGISRTDRDNRNANPDRLRPSFDRPWGRPSRRPLDSRLGG